VHESPVFDVLFLIGRPAAGKSEIIDFLRKTDVTERQRRFRIGDFTEFDDFPMIWSWFEEDKILEDLGKPRLHTDSEGYFTDSYLWNVLIRRLELDYHKAREDGADFGSSQTAIVEFARGSEHGGFVEAFRNFTPGFLRRGAILYIDVPFEESLRKNRRRFNPKKPHSVLEHGLPDDKLETLYGEVDWDTITDGSTDYVEIRGVRLPYAVFPNADDVTTGPSAELGPRLEETLSRLWQRLEAR
jgi:hypothetical protein